MRYDVVKITPARSPEHDRLLAGLLDLNNAHEVELSRLTPDDLRHLCDRAFLASRIGRVEAFLISFDQDADLTGVNFRWFRERCARFIYVDRIVVAPRARGQGHARRLYTDLIFRARRHGHDRIVCEVNADPPNPASDAFHARMGFRVIGSAVLSGSDKTVRYFSRALTDADLDDAKLS